MPSKARKRVIVLEDQGARIEWLRKYFGKYIDIIWCTTLDIFYEEISEPYDLLILDHDLDLTLPDTKTTQPNGADAARLVTRKTPVVIWSINKHGAMNIHSILRNKGLYPQWVPFGSDDLRLIEVIITALK